MISFMVFTVFMTRLLTFSSKKGLQWETPVENRVWLYYVWRQDNGKIELRFRGYCCHVYFDYKSYNQYNEVLKNDCGKNGSSPHGRPYNQVQNDLANQKLVEVCHVQDHCRSFEPYAERSSAHLQEGTRVTKTSNQQTACAEAWLGAYRLPDLADHARAVGRAHHEAEDGLFPQEIHW